MKTSVLQKFIMLLLCCISSTYSFAQMLDHVPGEVLVKIRPNKSATEKTALKNRMNANTLKTYPRFGIELWQVNDATDIKALANEYRFDATLEFIEPNYVYTLDSDFSTANHKTEKVEDFPSKTMKEKSIDSPSGAGGQDLTPSDPLLNNLWGLNNTGQDGGTPDADIDAPEAWDITTGSPSIKVAVIDTGIDYGHEDLVDNIWQNLGEDADGDGRVLEWDSMAEKWVFDPGDENGIDDDGNGYADDFVGWNFATNTNDPYDDRENMSHGTHVAGIIGATGNNGIGIAGVTWDVQMAALKIFGATSNSPQSASIEALGYAISMGFQISNNSWGGARFTDAMYAALQQAQNNNHLCIFSAGNYKTNNDQHPYYPASYPFDNIISVANTDNNDALYVGSGNYNGSQYGVTTVDIAAPGTSIFSTIRGNTYGSYTGTSMAAPHVTGACALLWGMHPMNTYAQIKSAILNSADPTAAMNGKCVSEGRLNLYKALTYFNLTPPPTGCRYNDSLALVALYNATDGANWTNTWDLGQPMDGWYGVTLNDSECVSEVNLFGNNLIGNIPVEIGNLTNLTNLSLSSNNLIGDIPVEIGNLTNLTGLYLYINNLTGNIPAEIGNLTNLRDLYLFSNNFTGNIPVEIGNLTNLTNLSLFSNNLAGNIPAEIGNLTNLTNLSLFSNSFIGNIPSEIGNLTNLTDLNLYSNDLTGDIPSEIGNLTNLTNLRLFSNSFSGNIPSEVENLTNLTHLYLYSNDLIGNIPSEIWNLTNLTHLYLYSNDLIGNIPAEIVNLTKLRGLDLSSNNLTGNIPAEIWNLTKLTYLRLSSNSLIGNIPAEIGNLTNLKDLQLHNNSLSGNIPSEIGNLTNLTDLYLSINNLTGNIPSEIGNLTDLTSLQLSYNNLSGNIPSEIGNLIDLTHFTFSYNQLDGCYDENLMSLCYQVSVYFNGNNFDAPWEDFCSLGLGTCAQVYPGDFNNDGIANEADYLYWGLALAQGSSGPARPNASIAWVGQDCSDWAQDVQGINGKHQDGNGSGTVTDIDQQTLLINFGKTHGFTQSAYLASSTIYRLEELPPSAGDLRYALYVEEAPGVPAVAHGVAFTFQSGDIDITNITMNTTNSSLQPYDELTVYDTDQNKLHIALTRNDGNNRTLSGPVAEFIVDTNDLPDGGEFELNIGNGTQVLADGTLSSIAGTTAYGINEGSSPSSGNLTLTVVVTHAECNTTGQAIVQTIDGVHPLTYAWNTGESTQTISDLTPGIYEVTVTDANDVTEIRSVEVYGNYIPIFDENGIPIPCNPNLCPTLLTPGGNVPSGTYQANTAVNSDGTIPTNGSVQYKAGDVIILKGDFEVQPGASFEAIIEDCDGN